MEHQKTIKKNITFSGIGIHKGTENKIKLIPTKDNYGIKFQKEETNKTLDLDIKYINNTNRSTNIKTEDLFNSLKLDLKDSLKQESLLLGGPVNPDAVFVLHSDPIDWKSSIKVSEKIALTTSGDILEAIAIGEGPDSYLIILGYSGWNPGQLEEELSENSWIEIPKDFDIIFNTPSKDQIDVLSKKIGFNLRMVSPDFGNA